MGIASDDRYFVFEAHDPASRNSGRETQCINILKRAIERDRSMPGDQRETRKAQGRGHDDAHEKGENRDVPVRIDIHSSEETVEISIEADFETLPQGSRRFSLLNIPRHLFR